MKDLTKNREAQSEKPLIEQMVNHKPEFATREAAIAAYSEKLELLAKRCGRTLTEMLKKAEHSVEFDEDSHEAMNLWMTLSALKRRG